MPPSPPLQTVHNNAPLITAYVNFANVGASTDGMIRLEFGEVLAIGQTPQPTMAVAMPRARAEEIAQLILRVLEQSAGKTPALPSRQ